jgi:hypothetical protein
MMRVRELAGKEPPPISLDKMVIALGAVKQRRVRVVKLGLFWKLDQVIEANPLPIVTLVKLSLFENAP